MFYYGYSPFSLVAGAAIDRFGAKRVVPIGAALVGVGSLLFGTGNVTAANIGRFLQGAGAFSPSLAQSNLITKNFPATMVASFVGATQMFGMAGGSAGQFAVGPLIKTRPALGPVLDLRGLLGIVLAVCMLLLLPKETRNPATQKAGGFAAVLASLGKSFAIRNPFSAV